LRITSLTPAPLSTIVTPPPLSTGVHTAPSFDPIELLPPAAADKLRALRQRSDDLHAVIPEGESIREASAAKIDAENALKRLVSHPQNFGFGLNPDDRRVVEAQRLVDKAIFDAKRLKKLQEVRTAAWQTGLASEGCLRRVFAPRGAR
jgi:hypothetical protein